MTEPEDYVRFAEADKPAREVEREVFADVFAERRRQDEMGHASDYPDGTGSETECRALGQARSDYDFAEQIGCLTWHHALREEVLEAFAEKDETLLQKELVQVAAVAIRWITAIRSRGRDVENG